MAKSPAKVAGDELLDMTEKLLHSLVTEANLPTDAEHPDGPDFTERLKVVEAVTKFMVVRNKLVPPEERRSMFKEMQDEFHGGKAGRAAAPGPGKARNGVDHGL